MELVRPPPRVGGHGSELHGICSCTSARTAELHISRRSHPPKVLVIGPRHDGQLLEVIILTLADERQLVIHAMPLRPTFHDLLPEGDL